MYLVKYLVNQLCVSYPIGFKDRELSDLKSSRGKMRTQLSKRQGVFRMERWTKDNWRVGGKETTPGG